MRVSPLDIFIFAPLKPSSVYAAGGKASVLLSPPPLSPLWFEKVHSADKNSLFSHLFAFSFFALCDFSPTSLSFFLLVCFTFPPPPEEQSVQAALRGRF